MDCPLDSVVVQFDVSVAQEQAQPIPDSSRSDDETGRTSSQRIHQIIRNNAFTSQIKSAPVPALADLRDADSKAFAFDTRAATAAVYRLGQVHCCFGTPAYIFEVPVQDKLPVLLYANIQLRSAHRCRRCRHAPQL